MTSNRFRCGAFTLITALLLPTTWLSAQAVETAAGVVPAPSAIFGFEPGADYKLATSGQILEYFRRLDAASERVLVREIGRSTEGRPLILAFISSEENIRRLEEWRRIAERLARAEGVEEAEARRLAEEGRAIVWIDGGLHATEVAGAQHTPLLAHRVATEESAEMRLIRENVVLLLMPVMNPDGLDLVTEWYGRNLGTQFETASLPVLYHRYTGHDNNRDWYMITQAETRAVSRVLYREWYPQIVYNHHQVAPFPARIFVPPFADPVNPNIPPLVVRSVTLVGDAITRRLEAEGKAGAVSRLGFDMWWNGGMRTVPYFHNMVGILTETALHRYATPRYYHPDSLPSDFGRRAALSAKQPSVFYPQPWRGGWWRLRDAVDYMLTASLAVLDIAAELKEEWLYDIWALGRASIEQGRAGRPYAYVIPAGSQWDAGAAVELVNALRRAGIEVQRATAPFEADGVRYAPGSYIVPAGQAFRPYVVDLFERQVYPDMRQYPGGPPQPPYDVAGWTLPLQMGVRYARVDAPFEAEVVPVDSARPERGRVEGRGGYGYLLSHASNASVLAVNRLLSAGERVSWTVAAATIDGRERPAGTFVVHDRGRRTRERVEALAAELGLDFDAIAAQPAVALERLRLPRVGLYKSWVANMDEGWTRWLLEQYAFPLDTLHDAQVRRGDLDRYDVIVLPDQSARSILNGHAPGTMPPAFTGGIGAEGAAALGRFIERGGTLVALDAATDFAIEQFRLPVQNAVAGLDSQSLYVPGSLLALAVDATDPLAFGMPDSCVAVFDRSRAFEVVETAREGDRAAPSPPVHIVATYRADDPLVSGWALGAQQHLAGRAAAVRVGLGKGEVVLIGFRPQFRAQPHATFKFLFNALHGATVERARRVAATAE